MKNYSSYSDTDLKATISSLRESKISLSKQLIEDVFGMVNESINRRLGIWKIFSGGFRNQQFDSYLATAEKIIDRRIHSPTGISYTDNFSLDDYGFGQSIAPLLDSPVLDDAEEIGRAHV